MNKVGSVFFYNTNCWTHTHKGGGSGPVGGGVEEVFSHPGLMPGLHSHDTNRTPPNALAFDPHRGLKIATARQKQGRSSEKQREPGRLGVGGPTVPTPPSICTGSGRGNTGITAGGGRIRALPPPDASTQVNTRPISQRASAAATQELNLTRRSTFGGGWGGGPARMR